MGACYPIRVNRESQAAQLVSNTVEKDALMGIVVIQIFKLMNRVRISLVIEFSFLYMVCHDKESSKIN